MRRAHGARTSASSSFSSAACRASSCFLMRRRARSSVSARPSLRAWPKQWEGSVVQAVLGGRGGRGHCRGRSTPGRVGCAARCHAQCCSAAVGQAAAAAPPPLVAAHLELQQLARPQLGLPGLGAPRVAQVQLALRLLPLLVGPPAGAQGWRGAVRVRAGHAAGAKHQCRGRREIAVHACRAAAPPPGPVLVRRHARTERHELCTQPPSPPSTPHACPPHAPGLVLVRRHARAERHELGTQRAQLLVRGNARELAAVERVAREGLRWGRPGGTWVGLSAAHVLFEGRRGVLLLFRWMRRFS